MEELTQDQLALVDGGSFSSAFQTGFARAKHGAYEAYKSVVDVPTAAIGGWKLAGQMYGAHVTMNDRVRAMKDVHHLLGASDTLPAWARFGH
ncbi:MAG TPA: hypothetical protein VFQ65_24550 [Kofleriaceae bacterium]|nr:hypothetical protein [Kofleriaceae bacterium]